MDATGTGGVAQTLDYLGRHYRYRCGLGTINLGMAT